MAERENQKARTRNAILDACSEILDTDTRLTMDTVAAHAEVSRATIYRYYSSIDEIAWAVLSDRLAIDTIDEVRGAGPDLTERLLAAERVVDDYLYDNADGARRWEVGTLQRMLDGRALEEDRPTRRFRFIDAALEEGAGALTDDERGLLRDALAMVIGTESMIALLDSARLEPKRARDVQVWAVRALVEAAITRSAATGRDGGG